MNVDEQREILKKARMLFPHIQQKRIELEKRNCDIVHYTSAANAVNIIRSGEFWMRSVREMNDLSELRHGQWIVEKFLGHQSTAGEKLWQYLDGVDSKLRHKVAEEFKWFVQESDHNTFVSSFSEHERVHETENEIGRLSMWRAYGGNQGVGLVFDRDKFIKEQDILTAKSLLPLNIYPAIYWSIKDAEEKLPEIIDNFIDIVKSFDHLSHDELAVFVNQFICHFMYCLKHKGFNEEREWRVLHSPLIWQNINLKFDALARSSEVINGIPQVVYKIPLKQKYDLHLNKFLKKVIIGPTNSSKSIAYSILDELDKADIHNVQIIETLIPLRSVN